MKPNNPIRTYVKCRGCGKRIRLSYFKYCPDCLKLDKRLMSEHIPPKAKESFWAYIRKFGRKCAISGVSLGIDDYTSPWYLDFSRLKAGIKNRIVPASALFSVMKSVLTRRVFRYYVCALDDNRRKHLKVKKRPIVHWRLAAPADKNVCPMCGRRPPLKGHKYCARCSPIAYRMKLLRFPPEVVNAIRDYLRTYGFVCYYTGMRLNLDNPNSPWYLVFDHWNPRDPGKIVVTSALVNKMKSDLTEEEFWYFIRQLANHFRYGTPVRKIKLAYWCRPYRVPVSLRGA